MAEYPSRAEEIFKDMEAIEPAPPEKFRNDYREAVQEYMKARSACLNALLDLVKDDSAGNKENAAGWTSLCQGMTTTAEDCLKANFSVLAALVGPGFLALAGQIGAAITQEKQFFSALSAVNAALVRDYLVDNLQDLQAYTDTLDKMWEAIVKGEEDVQENERKSYQEIEELAKEAVRDLAEQERTLKENFAKIGSKVFDGVSKLADAIEFVLDLPEGSSYVIEKAGEALSEMTKSWVEWNRLLKERIERYQSLVEQEKGGLLPIFKECRQQVYDYWNEKGTKTSKVWIDRSRSSLDDWKSALSTSGQKDDADRFSADVYSLIKEKWSSVEAVGKAFEEKWTGIFKGPLQPTTQDKLTDAIEWKENSERLIGVGVVELGSTFLKDSDEIYGASISEPLSQLQAAAESLPDEHEHKADALQAVAAVRQKIESELVDRIKSLQKQITESLQLLDSSTMQKTFDRSDLENLTI